MTITLNGKMQELAGEPSLNDIVQQFSPQTRRVIAELNGEIVRDPRWDEIRIREGDILELVSFVGGG